MEDVWDDTVIVNAFHKALNSHDAQNQSAKVAQPVKVSQPVRAVQPVHVVQPDARTTEASPRQINPTLNENMDMYGISDPTMVPLLMAWYNAGYQTGLREGLSQNTL